MQQTPTLHVQGLPHWSSAPAVQLPLHPDPGVQPQTPGVPPPPQVTPVPAQTWPQVPQLLLSVLRLTGVPAQAPLVQTSLHVDAFPSLHAEPSGLAGLEQTPVWRLQVPAT